MKKLIVALSLCLAVFTLSACGGSEASKSTSAAGNWSEPRFQANITNGNIKMLFVTDDTKYVYWVGSFPAETLKDGETVLSKGDMDAMENTITGTEDKTAEFTYEDGTLDFEFIFQGESKTVHLEKQ